MNLMYKISDRRQKEKGKELQGTMKFERKMKKLEWTMQDKGRFVRGVVQEGTTTILWKY